jgi:hypothetical protein
MGDVTKIERLKRTLQNKWYIEGSNNANKNAKKHTPS